MISYVHITPPVSQNHDDDGNATNDNGNDGIDDINGDGIDDDDDGNGAMTSR